MKSQKNKVVVNYNTLLDNSASQQYGQRHLIEAARQLAENLNAEIISIQTDDAKSSIVSKEQLDNLYLYCKQHPDVKYVFFDYPDRLFHSMTESYKKLQQFNKLGVEVKFIYNQMPTPPNYLCSIADLIIAEENYVRANRGDSQL